MAPDLEQLGLPVKVGVPAEERALLELYPQPRGGQSAVEYSDLWMTGWRELMMKNSHSQSRMLMQTQP